MAERNTLDQTRIEVDRFESVVDFYGPQLNRLKRYKIIKPEKTALIADSLSRQIDEIQGKTFTDFETNAHESGGLMASSIKILTREGNELPAKILKSYYANGLSLQALRIMADEEKDNLQKHKELSWIRLFAKKIKNRTVTHLAEKMIDDTPLNTSEKWQKFKEETEFKVKSYIKEIRGEFKIWRDSPLAQKLNAPAEFAIGAVASFIAADQAPQIINAENALKVHATLVVLRGASEIGRVGIRELEFKYPRFAVLSQNLASKKSVQRLFGDVEMLSDVAEKIGHTVTKFQTSAPVLGMTAGVFINSGFDMLSSPINTSTSTFESSPVMTQASTPTTEAIPTHVSTIPETPAPIPESISQEVIQADVIKTNIDNPINAEPPLETETSATPTNTTPDYQSHTHGYHETLTGNVLNAGYDPYGTKMTEVLLQNQQLLPEPLFDFFSRGGTVREIMNGNAIGLPKFQELNRLLTETWNFKPGTQVLLPNS